MIRFLLIALAVVALTFVVGCYLNGPAGVVNPECRDPTLTEAQALRHCSRLLPTSTWERISKGAPWWPGVRTRFISAYRRARRQLRQVPRPFAYSPARLQLLAAIAATLGPGLASA